MDSIICMIHDIHGWLAIRCILCSVILPPISKKLGESYYFYDVQAAAICLSHVMLLPW